jgi:hypothetical protein
MFCSPRDIWRTFQSWRHRVRTRFGSSSAFRRMQKCRHHPEPARWSNRLQHRHLRHLADDCCRLPSGSRRAVAVSTRSWLTEPLSRIAGLPGEVALGAPARDASCRRLRMHACDVGRTRCDRAADHKCTPPTTAASRLRDGSAQFRDPDRADNNARNAPCPHRWIADSDRRRWPRTGRRSRRTQESKPMISASARTWILSG